MTAIGSDSMRQQLGGCCAQQGANTLCWQLGGSDLGRLDVARCVLPELARAKQAYLAMRWGEQANQSTNQSIKQSMNQSDANAMRARAQAQCSGQA